MALEWAMARELERVLESGVFKPYRYRPPESDRMTLILTHDTSTRLTSWHCVMADYSETLFGRVRIPLWLWRTLRALPAPSPARKGANTRCTRKSMHASPLAISEMIQGAMHGS
jgi:hypothetical protein